MPVLLFLIFKILFLFNIIIIYFLFNFINAATFVVSSTEISFKI